ERSDLDMVRLLLQAGLDPQRIDGEGETILCAIDWQHASDEFIDALLALRIDVNHLGRNGRSVLISAVCRRDVRAVRRLLVAGAARSWGSPFLPSASRPRSPSPGGPPAWSSLTRGFRRSSSPPAVTAGRSAPGTTAPSPSCG